MTGVVFIIGGTINGNWADIWTGMRLVAFGVVDAITGVVLHLAQAIAGVVDALSGLLGGGTRWQQGIRDFREAMRADLAVEAGVQELSFTRPTAPPPSVPGAAPASALSTMPAVAAMAPAVAASFPVAPATPALSPPVVVQLQVDGQTLATGSGGSHEQWATRCRPTQGDALSLVWRSHARECPEQRARAADRDTRVAKPPHIYIGDNDVRGRIAIRQARG